MKTKKSRLFILTVICVLSAFFACAFMFSPASDNKENVVYAAGTSKTITTGQFFTNAYNSSNGWNIQDVENWKTSGKAISFDYKNDTGASFTSFWFAGYTSGSKQLTSQITVNLSSNTCSGAVITDLGDGWYNITMSYAAMNVNNNTETTINWIYFAGLGGKSLSLNNMNTLADEKFNPVTITTGTFYSSGWHIEGVENWKTSGYALSFDYKNNTGDSFTSFYFRGYSDSTVVTGDITVDLVNNMAKSGNDSVATVTSLGDGWYRVLANYENIPKSADGTLNKIYFAGIGGNSLSLNNITFKATAHSDGLASKLTAGAVYTSTNPAARNWNITDVANWKTSGKALYFEYKNVSGAAFYITPQSSSAAIARQITVNANNTVSFFDDAGAQMKYGFVTNLGDGWYGVLINYKDLGVASNVASNGEATLAKFYFTGVGSNVIYVNNFDTEASPIYTVSVTGGTIGGASSANIGDGQTATVIAGAPAAGKYFHHWAVGGESVSTDAEYTFTVDSDVAITAVYYDFHGTHVTAAWSTPSTATYDLDYDTVTFDYKPVGSNTAKIAIANTNWSKFYGYYTFTSTGTVDKTTGVSITPLDDGYFRVVMTTASLTWTNSANNRNNVPDFVNRIITNTASDWYIDNVVYYKACTVTVTNGTGGTTVNYGTSVTVVANAPAAGKAFTGWSDGESIVSANSSYTFTATGDVSLTATYGDIYTVSVTGGTINGESSAEIGGGQTATVIAGTPATGKYFHHWEIDGESVSTDAEYSFTVDSDVAITAVYYDFHGTHITTGGVWASESPYKIDYDTVTFDYKPVGTNVVRVCLFQPWSKYYGYYSFTSTGTVNRTAGISITPLDDGYYRVVMTIASLAWTNDANNLNNAPDQIEGIWSAPASDYYIDNVSWYKACTITVTNGTGGATVNYGTSVTVVANSAPAGKVFAGWSDGSSIVSADSSYTFTVTGNVSLSATYSNIVSVSATGGTVNGESSVSVGDGSLVTLVANAPDDGYYFLNWTNTAGDTVAIDATANVVVNGATTYTANYRAFDGQKYATTPISAPTGEYSYSRVIFEYKLTESGTDKRINFLLKKNDSNYYGMFKLYGYDYWRAYGYFTEGGSPFPGITVEALEDKYIRVTIDVANIAAGKTVGNPSSFSNITLNLNYSDEVYFRNVNFVNSGNPFAMENGASVRLKSPYGIRFRATIPWDIYDEEASYGIIIIPYDYIATYSINLGGDIIAQLIDGGIKYRNLDCLPILASNGDHYIQGSLTNLLEKNLTREFVGIGYSLKNDEYTYVTSASIIACRRTIVNVAEGVIKDYQEFTGYDAEKQDFLLETTGSDGAAAGAAFSANAFDSIENFKKNAGVSPSTTLTLSAAKGESEFGQIVLTATSSVANKAYTIIPNDLTHSDGTTVLSKENFELFNAYYANVDSNWDYWNSYSYATPIYTGYYVDALVPFYAASASSEAVFDRTNGDNQTIFVRFNIPAGQKAGVYTGSFRIYVLGIGYKDVSVSFTVSNFTLPEENNYKSKYGIDQYAIKDVFDTDHSRSNEEYAELYDLLLDYNLNGGQIPSGGGVYAGALTIDEYIADLVELYNNPKVAAIQLDCTDGPAHYEYKKGQYTAKVSYDLTSVIYEYDWVVADGVTSYGTRSTLKAIAEYCVENDINLFEKLYFRLNDEPNSPETCIQAILSYNAVKNGIDYALAQVDFTGHADIEASLRYLPYIVTVSPSQTVDDAHGAKDVLALYAGNKLVDGVYSKTAYYPANAKNSQQSITINYCYLTDYVPTYKAVIGSEKDSRSETIRTDSDANTHLWWYPMITTVNPYPNYAVNANQVINRSKTWATYYYGIEGELYYSVNDWREYHQTAQGVASSSLDEAAIWNGEAVYCGAFEEGVLVYPNVARYDGDFKYCPTYRLVATSEGIDDYNYICYAQSLIDQLSAGAYKTTKQAALDSYVASMVNSSATDAIINSSASTLRTARNNLIALIVELAG